VWILPDVSTGGPDVGPCSPSLLDHLRVLACFRVSRRIHGLGRIGGGYYGMYPGVISQSGTDVSGLDRFPPGLIMYTVLGFIIFMAPRSPSRCSMNIHLIN